MATHMQQLRMEVTERKKNNEKPLYQLVEKESERPSYQYQLPEKESNQMTNTIYTSNSAVESYYGHERLFPARFCNPIFQKKYHLTIKKNKIKLTILYNGVCSKICYHVEFFN